MPDFAAYRVSLYYSILLCFNLLIATEVSGQSVTTGGGQIFSKEQATKLSLKLDGSKFLHTYEGLGAIPSYEKLLFDYPKRQRNEIMDLLFKPGYGAELEVLKVEIGYDGNNTAVSWPSYKRSRYEEPDFTRGYVWWILKEAKKRNPNIKISALHWGYPAWANSPDLQAEFIYGFVKGARDFHGIEIDHIGGNANENFEGGRAFINMPVTIKLRKLLNENGFAAVKIVAADEGSQVRKYNIIDSIADNPDYAASVDIIGLHYKSRPSSFLDQRIHSLRKEIWSSEDGGGSFKNPSAGYGWADQIIRLLLDLKMSGLIRWSATASVYDNMPWASNGIIKAKEPWSGHYETGANLWSFSHFTHFINPGWKILDLDYEKNSLDTAKKYIAFSDPSTGAYSFVINTNAMNIGSGGIDLELQLSRGLSIADVEVWRSDFSVPSEWFRKTKVFKPVDGKIKVHLDKGCLYTISKGNSNPGLFTVSPPPRSFPFPYSENFESAYEQDLAPYFIDANGSFAIQKGAGTRKSKVLRQLVEEAPRMWHDRPLSQPLTEIGDIMWKDYKVSVDVLLEKPGAVHLAGRFDGSAVNGGNFHLEGYWLSLNEAGEWKLARKNAPVNPENKKDLGDFVELASGRVSGFGLEKWIELSLEFKGKQIAAYVGAEKVAELSDEMYPNGNVALATSNPDAKDLFGVTKKWTSAQFDNFRVSKSVIDRSTN